MKVDREGTNQSKKQIKINLAHSLKMGILILKKRYTMNDHQNVVY